MRVETGYAQQADAGLECSRSPPPPSPDPLDSSPPGLRSAPRREACCLPILKHVISRLDSRSCDPHVTPRLEQRYTPRDCWFKSLGLEVLLGFRV